jgi:hypothetical protein
MKRAILWLVTAAGGMALALGVDPHWVLARIRSGKLRASHRHTERTPKQGGDSWLATDEALLDFLRDRPYARPAKGRQPVVHRPDRAAPPVLA